MLSWHAEMNIMLSLQTLLNTCYHCRHVYTRYLCSTHVITTCNNGNPHMFSWHAEMAPHMLSWHAEIYVYTILYTKHIYIWIISIYITIFIIFRSIYSCIFDFIVRNGKRGFLCCKQGSAETWRFYSLLSLILYKFTQYNYEG